MLGFLSPILWFNIYCWTVILPTSVLLNLLAPLVAPLFARDPNAPAPAGENPRKPYAATEIYQRWTHAEQKYNGTFFSMHDIVGRYFCDVVGFYVALFAQPLRLIRFNLLQLPLW